MQWRILTICLFLLMPNLSFAQAKVSVYKNVNKNKYTPKLPNFFEGQKPRGELISVGPIVASKTDDQDTNSQDTFSAESKTENSPVMGNPLGILPKKRIEQITVKAAASSVSEVVSESNVEDPDYKF